MLPFRIGRSSVIILSLLFALVATAADASKWPGKIELPSFEKKDPVHAFAELKIYDTNGSPVRTPVEDWGGAKRRSEHDPTWREWVASRRAAVDEWISRRKDRTNWIAGWSHNFVSPVDGTDLVFTPDEPGQRTLSSATGSKVELTPKIHAGWVALFRQRHTDMMVEAARLYHLTGNTNYAAWAAAQLDFYSENYNAWPVHDGAHIMFQTLDDAVILIKWVTAARTLDEFVTPERKKSWAERLFEPQANLLNETFQVTHNIACWQRSAMGCAALYCNDQQLWQTAIDGTNGIRSEILHGVTNDYLWFEQSLGYNSYVVRALAPLFEYALSEGRGAELQLEMATVENLALAPLCLRFPNGLLPTPADGSRAFAPRVEWLQGQSVPKQNGDSAIALASITRLYPTKIGLRLAENLHLRSWEFLLDPPPSMTSAELPPVTSRNLESSRMAVLRGGPWQVYFHYGQLAVSHSQAEALNFEAFYKDVDITHDAGTPGYGTDLAQHFFRRAIAHNVPMIDGVGQKAGWEEGSWNPGKLESFSETSVEASQPNYRPNAGASRKLLIDGNVLCDEENITTTDGKEHALGFVLNLQGSVKLPGQFSPAPGLASRWKDSGFKFWENIRSAKMNNQADFDVRYGGILIRIHFELPGEFTVFHATVPDYVPNHREAFYVETRGKRAVLKTSFSPVVTKLP